MLGVIAVALVLLGGGAAVAVGLGRDEPPARDSVDVGFSRDMAAHHLQGVEMANLALARSSDPAVRQVAFDIASTQTNQVGRMQGWLALWGVPVSGGTPMSWMSGRQRDDMGMDMGMGMGGSASDASMPGMATESELTELRTLSGPGFDVQFLRLMIRHHQGGKDMADYAAAHAGQPAVRGLARSIADAQSAEIGYLSELLTARGGTPLPAP